MKQTDTAGEQTGRNGLFENLFVLELANNHWGSVERGKEIIRQHGKVVQETGVKAAVKFQFRDVDSFVHDAFKPNEEIERSGEVVQAPGSSSRYIKKTIATKLTPAEFAELLKEVRAQGMLTMATPFDERSVGWCKDLDIDIAKIASQDAKSWVLVERIAELGKPTIISNGGTDIADLDRVVELFKEKNVPLAINHCVSLYPSEDNELELNQVDYLRDRYPGYVIGYSTHEYYDWSSSVQITYAKGARTWERHIDIEDAEGTPVSKYCSLPHQCRVWFESFNKAKEMMGADGTEARLISEKEREYVLSVSRGAYALRDLKAGDTVSKSMVGTDYEFVIPLQGNQLSSRDLDADVVVTQLIAKGEAITFEKISAHTSQMSVSLTREGGFAALADGIVRAAWVAMLLLSGGLAGVLIGGAWTLTLTALVALIVGYVLTRHNRYELFPSTAQVFGSIINGLILGAVMISLIGLIAFGAPFYVPFAVLAISMVVTALMSRLSLRLPLTRMLQFSIGAVLLAGAVAMIGYPSEFSAPWLYFAYTPILLAVIEQLNIRLTNTGVLLPWVQLFWHGVALALGVTATLVLVATPGELLILITAPMIVGVICGLAAVLFVVSVFTRLHMRRVSGRFSQKRMIGVATLSLVGSLAASMVAIPALIGAVLVAALGFGDRNK